MHAGMGPYPQNSTMGNYVPQGGQYGPQGKAGADAVGPGGVRPFSLTLSFPFGSNQVIPDSPATRECPIPTTPAGPAWPAP